MNPEIKIEHDNREFCESLPRPDNNTPAIAFEKFVSPQKRNVPDRLIVAQDPDHQFPAYFIEYKKPGEAPTDAQLRDHARRRAGGNRVYVVDNADQGRAILMWHYMHGDTQCPGYDDGGTNNGRK